MSSKILIVDDEIAMQTALREVLSRQGYNVNTVGDAPSALESLEKEVPDMLITDVRMPEMTGIELLARVTARWPQLPVVVMTAYGTVEDAVQAMKQGASDYLLKPFSSETVEAAVKKHLTASRKPSKPEESVDSDPDAADVSGADPIAVSPVMQNILTLSREIADSTATVLIQGESGTGKEVLARYVHQHSGRRNGPFVALNCAALPEGLLESELFGHEKGAFTGAVLSRKGKFELANNGTLLLDEVSEMPLALQAKLLRALQEREIDPIGAQKPTPLNVRVIATSNRNLTRFVEEGHFREDLFYRLQVIHIELPPLRSRPEDILPLSDFFVRRLCRTNHRPRKRLAESMVRYLGEQPWRGNVRELENFLERAVLLCKEDEITPDNIHLGRAPRVPMAQATSSLAPTSAPHAGGSVVASGDRAISSPIPASYGQTDHAEAPILAAGELVTLEEMERRMILRTLEQVDGNRTRAADLLGVSVRTIRNKLNQYGLSGKEQEVGSNVG